MKNNVSDFLGVEKEGVFGALVKLELRHLGYLFEGFYTGWVTHLGGLKLPWLPSLLVTMLPCLLVTMSGEYLIDVSIFLD